MKEKVSALLDGALDEAASDRMLDTLKRDAGLRREWERYSLIGDVLRDEPVLSADFTGRLMLQLDSEPTILAPARVESRSGWAGHFMPIAASVMGVAAVLTIGPVSSPASMRMRVTPVSVSPLAMAHWMGAAPR